MRTLLLTCSLAAAPGGGTAKAALNIPTDGSDGDLVITANTEIDLSLASTNKWDADNSARAGTGVYDAEKWAVVFKYSSVTIGPNATVTFKNHASRAPVVWLVQSNVTINGTVNLDGQVGATAPYIAEPGPGGFRGGMGTYASGAGVASGFGLGGGRGIDGNNAVGGAFGPGAPSGLAPYGNPSLIPLVGGSGGGGDAARAGGGGGGGAILIASRGVLSLTGLVTANGADAKTWMWSGFPAYAGGGSGGGIRLVATEINGNGRAQALAGKENAGLGRIRIERVTSTLSSDPIPAPSVVTLSDGDAPQLWLPDNGPVARILSVGGVNSPGDPIAGFGAYGADVTLPKTGSAFVVVETTNVEAASVVTVRRTPRANGNYTETQLHVQQTNSVDPLVLFWTNNVPVNDGYSAMQVRVVRP